MQRATLAPKDALSIGFDVGPQGQALAGGMCYVGRMVTSPSLADIEAFDERQFYLEEFRGKTLLLALHADDLEEAADEMALAGVVRTLTENGTRTVVIVGTGSRDATELQRLERKLLRGTLPEAAALDRAPGERGPVARIEVSSPDDGRNDAVIAQVWSALRRGPLFIGLVPGTTAEAVRALGCHIASRFRIHKLVLVDREGGFAGSDGKPISFLDEAALAALLRLGEAEWIGLGSRLQLVETIRRALVDGVNSVNVCSLIGTVRELFTYEGSGTLFTLEDYCTIDLLGIDDFEEAERLIERGQREGLLKPRSQDEIALLLANGYGATIATHHLAGFAAFITKPYRSEHAGEIVGLYTITRFKGEGVGDRLIDRILADGRATRLRYVFATTTSARARTFFERRGFRRVAPDDVPAAKWRSYDEERKRRVSVLRIDLGSDTGETS